jgi:peptidoglycan/LPS O-acetylase OafA/YrhL
MKIKLGHLEGLRGVMAFVIFICHLRNFFWVPEIEQLYFFLDNFFLGEVLSYLIKFLLLGDYCVWVFWMLSAYVIMIKLFKEHDVEQQHITWLQSISKRYFRLLIPSLFSILFAFILLKNNLMFNHILSEQTTNLKTKQWLESLYNFEPSFFLAMKDAFVDTFFNFNFSTSYNNVLWSIENEFLGSGFIFLIFIFIRKNKYRFIIYLLGIIFIISLKKYWLLSFLYGYIFCDIDFSNDNNYIKNRIIAIERSLLKFKKNIFCLILIFIIFQNLIFKKLNINISSQDLITSILLFYSVLKFDFLKNFFSKHIFLFLGKISFALYLIHIPILSSLSSFLILQNNSSLSKTIISSTTIVVTIAASYVFTIFIDQKSVVISNKIGKYIAGFFYKPQSLES